MNEALKREINEETVAVRLANYILDRDIDPDGDMSVIARQFLRKREVIRSIVAAIGGHVFVPSSIIVDPSCAASALVVAYNAEKNGYDVTLSKQE